MSAAGALCNLGLDFSSVKDTVVSNGALESLVCSLRKHEMCSYRPIPD